MRINRVYEAASLEPDTVLTLSESNRRHLGHALRLGPDARLRVFDGVGNEFEARVDQADKRRLSVRLGDRVTPVPEPDIRVTIGLGMSLGDRMEYAIQKATELGVGKIVPVQCDRSELRLAANRAARKQERWQRVAISACEQCGRATVPEVTLPVSTGQWLAERPDGSTGVFLHHEESVSLQRLPVPGEMYALIGPEGGLSDGEIRACRDAGCHGVRLGPRVLRTETAPVVLMTAVQTLWGDLLG